jgi:hypothetical protein
MLRSAESASLLITTVSATMLTMAVFTAQPWDLPVSEAEAAELDVSTGLSLDRIANADRVLPALRVETSKGEQIGEVQAVRMGRNGIEAVTVKTRGLFGAGTASVKAEDLVYMPGRNTLVSRLTGAELASQRGKQKKLRL